VRTLIFVVLLLAFSTAVGAQNTESALFVESALIGDYTRSQSSTVLGGSVSIGFRLAKHFGVRFDVEVPCMHTRTLNTENPGVFRTVDSFSSRTITYGVMAAGDVQTHKRVNLAFLAGLSDAVPETRGSGYLEILAKDGSVVRREDRNSSWSDHTGALSYGVDVAVTVTSHLAIVPELRFHTYGEFQTVSRPKVAVRWTF
jgi:hypothetical protein